MIEQSLKNEILVLDGGFTTELEKMGFSFSDDPLWGARALYTDPETVKNVHKSYLESGANIITTASYQASIPGFQKHLGISENQSIDLLKSSVYLAKQAIKEYLEECSPENKRNIFVAGSIGPYGTYLADGSEYTGNYCDHLTHEELVEWHRPKIQHLIEAGVDILAFETIPAAKEGIALIQLLESLSDAKAWLSFSCQSLHQTAHNEDIGDAVGHIATLSSDKLLAVGVNCCPPDYALSLLKDISTAVPNIPLVVYPNSGENWDSQLGRWEERPDSLNFDLYVNSWLQLPVKIVGGCCQTGPKNISNIAKNVINKKLL